MLDERLRRSGEGTPSHVRQGRRRMGATLKHPNLAFVCQQTGPTVGPTAHPQGSTANRRRSRVNCAGRGFRAHKRKGRNHCSAIGRLVTSCSTRPPRPLKRRRRQTHHQTHHPHRHFREEESLEIPVCGDHGGVRVERARRENAPTRTRKIRIASAPLQPSPASNLVYL